MTTEEIIKAWLKANGYDGLYRDDSDDGCSCGIDDLFPCITCVLDQLPPDCKAGYKQDEQVGAWIGAVKNESDTD